MQINKRVLKKFSNTGMAGNISIIALISVIIFALLFLLFIDLARIFVARTMTKKASDAAALAIAQDLLFFEKDRAIKTAIDIAGKNNCDFESLDVAYDEVIVANKKVLEFALIGIFFNDTVTVTSVSHSKVIYPWDKRINLCKRYRFDCFQ